MLMPNAPPLAVILDEAVELAKVYSTDGSPAFVNGVLSSIAENILS
jgi:N utilization substance protein B